MRWRRWTRKSGAIGVAGVLLLVLVACEQDPEAVDVPDEAVDDDEEDAVAGGDGDAVEISYLTHWPPEQVDQLEEAAEAYVEETNANVQIDIREVSFGELLSTLRSQASTPEGPTIAGVYDLWLPELVRDDIAAPAPDGAQTAITEGWPDNLIEAVQVEGETYGFPNEVNLYAVNYNRAVLDEAGVDEAPATWEELLEAGQQIVDAGAAEQGVGLITNWPAGVVHPWLSLVVSNGGQLLDEDHRPQLDSDAALAATELYAELVESGATNPDMSTADATTLGPYQEYFVNEDTGMIVMANWWRSALEDGMGEDFDDVETAPVPVGPDGDEPGSVSYSWLTMVNARADEEQQQAAWDFLTWLNGPESGEGESSVMGDILIGMGILPSAESDIDAHQDTLDTPFFEPYVEGLPDATPFPIVLGGEELTDAIQSSLESVIVGDLGPEEAMAEAQDRAESILGQYYDW